MRLLTDHKALELQEGREPETTVETYYVALLAEVPGPDESLV